MRANVELPVDMIESLLFKLPSKSLVRFKCVSREWRDLISRNEFKYQWYKKKKSSEKGKGTSSFLDHRHCWGDNGFIHFSILHYGVKFNLKLEDSFSFKLPYFAQKGNLRYSYFGSAFVCPASFGFYCVFNFDYQELALWNPTTGELNVLPWPSLSKSDTINNFGFAHVEYNDNVFSYKVGMVGIKYNEETDTIHLTIVLYSSSKKCWKFLHDCCRFKILYNPDDRGICKYSGTVMDGKFYFLTWFGMKNFHITAFDMSTEEFGRIEVPKFLVHDPSYYVHTSVLTKFDEKSLCVLLRCKKQGKVYFEAWVQLESSQSWTLKSSMGPIQNIGWCELLGINDSIGGLFFQGVKGVREGLFFCSYGSEEPKTLLDLRSSEYEYTNIGGVVEYEESIVSFDGISDQRIKLPRLTC